MVKGPVSQVYDSMMVYHNRLMPRKASLFKRYLLCCLVHSAVRVIEMDSCMLKQLRVIQLAFELFFTLLKRRR